MRLGVIKSLGEGLGMPKSLTRERHIAPPSPSITFKVGRKV